MKNFLKILFPTLLIMLCSTLVFAQTTEPEPDFPLVNLTDAFTTEAAVIGLVISISAFLNKLIGIKNDQDVGRWVVSAIVSAAVTFLGSFLNIGVFDEITILASVTIGVNSLFAANGLYKLGRMVSGIIGFIDTKNS